jgi:hypothetical protein
MTLRRKLIGVVAALGVLAGCGSASHSDYETDDPSIARARAGSQVLYPGFAGSQYEPPTSQKTQSAQGLGGSGSAGMQAPKKEKKQPAKAKKAKPQKRGEAAKGTR